MKKNIKKRVIFVILFIIICSIYFYINLRGEYLKALAIDEKYVEVFKIDILRKLKIFISSFAIIYTITYITTRITKKGLKKFFTEENVKMPKLPNKSISMTFGVIGSAIIVIKFYEKILLSFSNVWFGQGDPIFNLDIAYYMFIIPFIKLIIGYAIVLFVILTIYIATYYIITFNKFFSKGINFETLKANTFLRQLTTNLLIIIILIAILLLINVTDIFTGGFMQTQDGTTLYGAGLVEITIKGVGYVIFSIFMVICTISAIKRLKEGQYKKAVLKMVFIPSYLIILFLLIISTEFIYLKNNEFDKEKEYIIYNIEGTKEAYNISIQEISIENKGTITKEDVEKNQELIQNINLLNEEVVLKNLKEYYTNLGYYNFNRAQVGYYNNELVYVSPREILSNNSRTYNNKTYQYTHGYDVIITSASKFENSGLLKYKRSTFNKEDEFINIEEPRIYFGLQTDEVIVTNTENEMEYDYPLTNTTNVYNTYRRKSRDTSKLYR